MIRRVLREQQTAGVIECQGHFYIISTKRFRGNVIMLNEEAQTPEQARCAQTVDRNICKDETTVKGAGYSFLCPPLRSVHVTWTMRVNGQKHYKA